MTGMQWDEKQFAELTGGRELTPYEQYRIGRDTPAPYVEPRRDVAPGNPPVIDYQMKRWFAAGGFRTVCYMGIEAAAHGAFTAAFSMAANVLAVIGVTFVAIFAVRLALSGDVSSKPEGPTPGDFGKTINIHVNVGGENVTVNK